MNCDFLHEFTGLQFMPIKATKVPIVKGWQTFAGKHDLSNCEAVGLVCGKLSGGIEVIDIDEKYSLDGKLFENFKKQVHSVDRSLLDKMVVQRTKNGGYHFIYRCSVISGNVKFANRTTTETERAYTYQKTYEAQLALSKTDAEAKKKAENDAANDKVRVLLESRGEGGMICCFPSPGYELIHRDFYGIMDITPEERETLHSIARGFNQVFEEVVVPKSKVAFKMAGLSPFDDYNQRGDVVALLESHGWKIVGSKGTKTIFLRPGQATSQTSGNYDSKNNWFSVFTTSSVFEPEKAYLPYAVFATLECDKNFSLAAKKLYELGYGERHEEKKPEQQSTRVIKSRIDPTDNDLSFLASPCDYEPYLQQVIDGTLPFGKTTGSPQLDQHFLFKEGELIMTNGIDNTGKTVWVWWLLLLAAMYHGWRGIIFSSENTLGNFMRKMIQFYWGKPLSGKLAMSPREYEIAKKFVEDHFDLIKAQEDLYNYKDILNMVKKAAKVKKYQYGMIDPYNSLKIDLSGFSKLNTHEYHYEAFSELKSFGQQNNFGWFINHHAITNAARAKDGEKKYPLAPGKADTEGGQKVANKADSFLTIHRITQHPTDWMVTEVHVRKIKDTETGGRPTPHDSPVKFEMYKNGCAFIERNELGGAVDPIHSWHYGKGDEGDQIEIPVVHSNGDLWLPYMDKDEPDPF